MRKMRNKCKITGLNTVFVIDPNDVADPNFWTTTGTA